MDAGEEIFQGWVQRLLKDGWDRWKKPGDKVAKYSVGRSTEVVFLEAKRYGQGSGGKFIWRSIRQRPLTRS